LEEIGCLKKLLLLRPSLGKPKKVCVLPFIFYANFIIRYALFCLVIVPSMNHMESIMTLCLGGIVFIMYVTLQCKNPGVVVKKNDLNLLNLYERYK